MNANINMDEKGLSELYRQDVMVCKSCRKRQQRVKSYKNIAICSIVTCGVFVFSTIVVSLVFFIQLSNRLDDTDNTNAELKARIAVLDRDLQRVFNLIQRSRSLAPYAVRKLKCYQNYDKIRYQIFIKLTQQSKHAI